jgi:hypothetical protein
MTNLLIILMEFTKSHLIQSILGECCHVNVDVIVCDFRVAIWIITGQGGAYLSPFQI